MRLSPFLPSNVFTNMVQHEEKEKQNHFHYCENASFSFINHASTLFRVLLGSRGKSEILPCNQQIAFFIPGDLGRSFQRTKKTHIKDLSYWCDVLTSFFWTTHSDYSSLVIQVFYFDVELHCAADVRSSEYRPDLAKPPGLYPCEQSHYSISIFISLSSVHLLESLSPPHFQLCQNIFLSPPSHPVFHLFPLFSLHRCLLLPIFSPSVLSSSANFFPHIVQHLLFLPLHLFHTAQSEESCETGVWQPGRENEGVRKEEDRTH